MKEFASLTEDDNSAHAVDAETAEWDAAADDNTRGAL
jgi:hypothetical protein